MENLIVPLLLIHVILYLAWKMTAMDEKNSRKNGKKIPTYATGGLGNLIGFSLMTTGVGLMHSDLLEPMVLGSVFLVSIIITTILHFYWKQTSQGKTTSLYDPKGNATLAGMLHLIYVVFISMMILVFLIEIHTASTTSVLLFTTGVALYGIAIVIDKQRGVI